MNLENRIVEIIEFEERKEKSKSKQAALNL